MSARYSFEIQRHRKKWRIRKGILCRSNQQSWDAVLIQEKVHFKTLLETRTLYMGKRVNSMSRCHIIHKTTVPKYVKQIETELVGDTDTVLRQLMETSVAHTQRGQRPYRVSKQTGDLNDTLHQLDLTNMYGTRRSATIHILLRGMCNALRARPRVGLQSSLGTFLKIKIIQSIFSNQNGMRLEISNRRKTTKITNMWKLNNTLFKNKWVKEDFTREIRKCSWGWKWKLTKMKTQHTKIYRMQWKQCSKRKL